ncbi:MAG: penicillin acylase family protein [Saprospiraceae bacterium]|nr:penicillin acylase family protein [Saprospiraceae bacterium]MDW8482807.1 penicillin acylase family protein [Saprospiraceae bacterium]
MRGLFFFVSLAAVSGYIGLLSISIPLGQQHLPALGDFFNPFSGFWQNAEPATGPPIPREVKLTGLRGKVEVVYDDMLVPHIFAEHLEDALRAQGYITAQHRLWQMDLTARRAAGRLSEVFGTRALELDRLARRRGLPFAAENALRGWRRSPEGMRLLEAYCEGVNAWIKQLKPANYPLEFKLLGYKPEPWSPLKTALIVENMAETLCGGENDLLATVTLETLGRKTFDHLYPEWNSRQKPIVSDTGQWRNIQRDLNHQPALSHSSSSFFPIVEKEPILLGSNNWAVAGTKTQSGAPMLCNDPHLTLSLPSIWFQLHICTPEVNCYGVSLQGIPGIIIGFNEHIAWAVTNAGHDVADWYRIRWVDSARTRYQIDEKEFPITWRVERIAVRGQETIIDSVRYTRWGPVTYDNQPDHPLRDCAFRWVTHDEPSPNEMRTFLFLCAAKTYEDYRKAIAYYHAPAQNFAFASRQGDIAITVQGKLPARNREQGRFILEGSSSANAWAGFIPDEHLPALRSPQQAFVFSANQHSTPPSYPYYYTSRDFDDYRGRRLYDRLRTLQRANADSMARIQLDNFSQRAADALPIMLRLLDQHRLDAQGKQWVTELKHWDYRYESASTIAPLYEVWFDTCYALTWDEMMDSSGQKQRLLLPERWRFIELLEKAPTDPFFDRISTPQRETASDIVTEAFLCMQRFFKTRPSQRTNWGKFRPVIIRHLAQIEAFSRHVEVGGHSTALNALSRTHGPSWRVIVELGPDQVRARGVYPGGQSGNPGSHFYDNFLDAWAQGHYYDLLFPKVLEDLPANRLFAHQILLPQ